MTHVAHIQANIKGGVNALLGPCTLVTGANASGKSGLVAALELALTGRSAEAGAEGRYLMEMAPADAKVLGVSAKLSDGRQFGFTVKGSTSRASRPVRSGDVSAVLLGDAVSDLLRKDAKKQRQALLEITCGDVSPDAVEKALAEAYQTQWRKIWDEVAPGAGSVPDALLAARARIEDHLKATRKRLKKDLGERPSNVVALRAGECRLWVQQCTERLAAIRQTEALNQAAVEREAPGGPGEAFYRAALTGARGAYDAIAFLNSQFVDPDSSLADGSETTACLCCNREGLLTSALPQLVLAASQQLEEVRAKLTEVSAQNPLLPPPAAPDTPELKEAKAVLREAERALGEALAAQVAQEAWDEATAAQRRDVSTENALKALRIAVDSAIGDAVGGAVGAFEETASAFLPKGERLRIVLIDKKKAVCRVGLEDPELGYRSWRAMCGAERARLVAAMAGAWGAKQGSNGAMRIVRVDDVWLGPGALDAVMTGLQQAVYEGALDQVIVCAVDASRTARTLQWTEVKL